jgi:hypothetical protein
LYYVFVGVCVGVYVWARNDLLIGRISLLIGLMPGFVVLVLLVLGISFCDNPNGVKEMHDPLFHLHLVVLVRTLHGILFHHYEFS